MYQALYRKYRPRYLEDVMGQSVAMQIINNSIEKGKLSHAYLFSGPRGCGKTSVAKILANLINCEEIKDNKNCGKCVFCTQNDEQKLDVIEIDAASNNGVDEIREINKKVKLAPSVGKYKVYIIDEVHMLSIGAFNALLKTLEEPPQHVIFILATTDPQKVPVTILSRCQKIEFKRLSNNEMEKGLNKIISKESIEINNDALIEIIRLSDGGMRDAISMLDQLTLYCKNVIKIEDVYDMIGIIDLETINNFINNIITLNIKEVLESIDNFSNNGKSIIKITEQIINTLRNKIIDNIETNLNEKNILILNELNRSLADMRKFNDPKLILDISIIKVISKLGNKFVDVNQNIDIDTEKELFINNNLVNKFNEKEKIEKNDDLKMSNNRQENISREIIKPQKANDEYLKFVDRRVENTLANFSKKILIDLKNKSDEIKDFLHHDEYKKIVPLLLDSEIKAASENNIICVSNTQSVTEMINRELVNVEKLIKEIYGIDYKVISVHMNEWEKIKESFNNKIKSYTYIKESLSTSEMINKLYEVHKDPMEEMFVGIVEYR